MEPLHHAATPLMPVLAAGEAPPVVRDLLVVLATAAGVGMVLRRLKLALIPGYLLAGAIFGPGLLGFVDATSTGEISGLAIVLLMFTIGLTLSREELRGGLLPVVGVGVLSTFATLVCATPLGLVFGLDMPRAVAVAGAMSMSSTAVILRLLQQRGELKTAHGRIAFGTLLTQDLIVVFMLAALPLLTNWAGISSAGEEMTPVKLLSGFLVAVGAVGLLVIIGGFVLPRLIAEAAKDRSGELGLLVSGAAALGAAVLTGAVGLSPELGAFVAGLLLANTPYRHELQGKFGPTRDIFMAIFFTAVGMQLDLSAVGDAWWAIPICLIAIILVKIVTIGGSAWVFGARTGVAWVAGITLAQAGEFSLVVFFAARDAGLIEDERVVGVVIAVVVTSLILTPALIDVGRKLVGVFRKFPSAPWTLPGTRRVGMIDNDAVAEDASIKRTRVIVAGYGPIGRTLADRFIKLGADVRIIELNAATVQRQSRTGQATIFGDASNPVVLREAGVAGADAVILTMPDEEATLAAIHAVRSNNKTVFIAARAAYLSKAFAAKEAGADHVTVEEMATADAMQRQVLEAFETRKTKSHE